MEKISNFFSREYLKSWVWKKAHSKSAEYTLFVNAFTEASFFPIPPDLLLIGMLVAGAKKWIRFALITTIGSVLGAIIGYAIGLISFESVGVGIVSFLSLDSAFKTVEEIYNENVFWGVFIAGFSPIPYKVFTIAGGFFEVNLPIFILASIISRGMRFFLVAYIAGRFGKLMGDFIYRSINVFSLLFVIVILFILFLL
jgi:membrane protein YqaA with SNARE-associated domain